MGTSPPLRGQRDSTLLALLEAISDCDEACDASDEANEIACRATRMRGCWGVPATLHISLRLAYDPEPEMESPAEFYARIAPALDALRAHEWREFMREIGGPIDSPVPHHG